jgi:hypothetical protein
MDQGCATVIGMSIAYGVSILGMLLAAWRWKQNQKAQSDEE